VLSSHSVVSSSRTFSPCCTWWSRWIGHCRTTCSTVCSVPQSLAAEEAIPHLYRQERKRPTPVRRRLSRSQALLGRVNPGVCVPVFGIEVRSLVGLSAHSAFHWLSAHCTARMLFLSEKLMSCCAAGTNWCLDMRRRAAAPDGRGSAEWSRCPGSMARHPRDSVAPLRRSSAGWMPARIERLSAGLGRRHTVTIRKASLMMGSMRWVWAPRHQTGAQYSAVEWTRARVAVRNVVASAPQLEPASRLRSATRDVSFLRNDSRCRRYVSDLSNVTPRYLGWSRRGGFRCWSWLSAHVWLPCCWDGRLLTPFSWCWALASKSGVIHVVLPCPCSAPLSLPANLHQHARLPGRQHMHTFWRWWLADQRCRRWTVGAPGQIPVGRRSWGVVSGGKGKGVIVNHLHDHVDHVSVRQQKQQYTGEPAVPYGVVGCCEVDKDSSGLLFSWKAILDVLCQQGDLI